MQLRPVGSLCFPIAPVTVMAVTGHQGWEPGQRLIGEDAGKVMNLAVEPTRGAPGEGRN